MPLEIRRLEEPEVFDSLRLSVEVLADVAVEVLAEILAAEVLVELTGGSELV